MRVLYDSFLVVGLKSKSFAIVLVQMATSKHAPRTLGGIDRRASSVRQLDLKIVRLIDDSAEIGVDRSTRCSRDRRLLVSHRSEGRNGIRQFLRRQHVGLASTRRVGVGFREQPSDILGQVLVWQYNRVMRLGIVYISV